MSVTTAATDEHPVRVQRIQLEVTGMSCASCANRVESTLNKLPGVRASVNFATRVATIDAGEDTEAAELCEVVHQAGYQAELRSTGGQGEGDPDADHARYLLIRLAVAAVLFVPLADLSVMFAVVPSTRFTGCSTAVLTATRLAATLAKNSRRFICPTLSPPQNGGTSHRIKTLTPGRCHRAAGPSRYL